MLLKKKNENENENENEINISISSRAHDVNLFKINQQVLNIFIKQ